MDCSLCLKFVPVVCRWGTTGTRTDCPPGKFWGMNVTGIGTAAGICGDMTGGDWNGMKGGCWGKGCRGGGGGGGGEGPYSQIQQTNTK
jgi:hypothetical protein